MTRFSLSEVRRALRAADWPEDEMATEDDLLRYEGRAEAVEIIRDMLGLAAEDMCRDRHPLHYAAAPGPCVECLAAAADPGRHRCPSCRDGNSIPKGWECSGCGRVGA